MAEILTFPVTDDATVRLEAIDLFKRSSRSRINRLRAIDKATIHAAAAAGVPLMSAMEIANRHRIRIRERLEHLDQFEAGYLAPVHAIAAGGRP